MRKAIKIFFVGLLVVLFCPEAFAKGWTFGQKRYVSAFNSGRRTAFSTASTGRVKSSFAFGGFRSEKSAFGAESISARSDKSKGAGSGKGGGVAQTGGALSRLVSQNRLTESSGITQARSIGAGSSALALTTGNRNSFAQQRMSISNVMFQQTAPRLNNQYSSYRRELAKRIDSHKAGDGQELFGSHLTKNNAKLSWERKDKEDSSMFDKVKPFGGQTKWEHKGRFEEKEHSSPFERRSPFSAFNSRRSYGDMLRKKEALARQNRTRNEIE